MVSPCLRTEPKALGQAFETLCTLAPTSPCLYIPSTYDPLNTVYCFSLSQTLLYSSPARIAWALPSYLFWEPVQRPPPPQAVTLWARKASVFMHSPLVLCIQLEMLSGLYFGFPDGTSDKEPTCQCRRCKRRGFKPWVRKNPMDRGAWQATVHRVAQGQTRLK